MCVAATPTPAPEPDLLRGAIDSTIPYLLAFALDAWHERQRDKRVGVGGEEGSKRFSLSSPPWLSLVCSCARVCSFLYLIGTVSPPPPKLPGSVRSGYFSGPCSSSYLFLHAVRQPQEPGSPGTGRIRQPLGHVLPRHWPLSPPTWRMDRKRPPKVGAPMPLFRHCCSRASLVMSPVTTARLSTLTDYTCLSSMQSICRCACLCAQAST